MSRRSQQERYHIHITQFLQTIRDEAKKAERKALAGRRTDRRRRSSEEAAKIRAAVLSERAQGFRAVELAERFGVTIPTPEDHEIYPARGTAVL